MPSIFMGPYPTRFTRAPSALAKRSHCCGLTSGNSSAIPALQTLYSIRTYGAAAAQPAASPRHVPNATVSSNNTSHTTQLATLPTTLVTQVTHWRQTRTCCTSATPPCSSTPGLVEPPTHRSRRVSTGINGNWRRRSSLQWAALPDALSGSAVRNSFSLSLLDGAALSALLEAPVESVVGDASSPSSFSASALTRVSSAAAAAAATAKSATASSAATTSPSSSPSATTTTAAAAASSAVNDAGTASLHTARRHYGSAAANADGDNENRSEGEDARRQHRSNDGNGKDTNTSAEEGAEALPTFEDVCVAFRTLGLLGPDGCVVRTWTAADIKRAYRALAKELHPDVAGGSSTQMERVNSAYDLLCSLSEEVADNYRVWLEMGGEVEMWACDTHLVQSLLRWTSRDVVQFMMVGCCTTLSGLAFYAGWSMVYGAPGKVSVSAAAASAAAASQGGVSSRHTQTRGRLTFPRAGAAVSSAPGVQYGVVSPGGSLFASAGLPQWCVQLVRTAVSRYALAVALTVAACVNTVMVQRVVLRLLTGST